MNRSTYRITLDLHDRRPLVSLRMTAGDTARRICISFADGAVPYVLTPDVSARLCAVKPSGAQIFNTMTVSGGAAYYDVTSATLDEPGTVECQVRLYDAENGLISSPRFTIESTELLLDDGSIERTNEYTALTAALGSVNGAVSDCAAASEQARSAAEAANGAASGAVLSKQAADRAAAEAESAGRNALAATASADGAAKAARDAAAAASDNAAKANTAAEKAEAAADGLSGSIGGIYDEISSAKETFMSFAGCAVYRRKMFMPLTGETAVDLKLEPSDIMQGQPKGLVMFTYCLGKEYTGTFTVRTGSAGSQYEYTDIPLGKLVTVGFPTASAPTFAYRASEDFPSGAVDMTLIYPKDITSSVYKNEGSIQELSETVSDVRAYLGYTDEDIAGLCVDYRNRIFTRLAGAYGKNAGSDFDSFPMFGGRKRCNVSNDGTITAYYGDDNYAEDGSAGQVMVYQPAFWYRVVPLVLDKNTESGIGYHIRKANYYVSGKPKPGFKLHPAFYDENGDPVDYILMSAYEGSMWDASAKAYVNDSIDTSVAYAEGDLMCSVAGKKPISGLRSGMGTRANFEAMCRNRGAGWHLENIKVTSANQLLMIIELGTMNTKTEIANGVVSVSDSDTYNCSGLTGSTAELGNGTGQASETVNEIGGTETAYNTNGKTAVTYRGVENPWGNIWKQIQGINIWGDGTMCGGQPYIADDFIYKESKKDGNYHPVGFTLANAIGYVNAMGYGKEEYDWVLMPSEIGGTSALPVGNYCYATANLNGYKIALLGGSWSEGSKAGGFYWYCSAGFGYRYRVAGGRIVYVPAAKI